MDATLLLFAGLVAALIFIAWRMTRHQKPKVSFHERPSTETSEKDPYNIIDALTDFDWAATPPIKVWPFKPKYHMTMALENLDLSELIEIDNTYADRMKLRRTIMDEHPAATKQCNKSAESAVFELYDWVVTTYLPKRFPTIYSESGSALLNSASRTYLPFRPASAMAALDILGEHVDTDFLILLPPSKAADGSPIYHLQAFVTCFPSGFSTREKCGKPLATIHKPVPGYQSKLEKSMDRFFAKLETGRAVKRANWSITTNDQLYSEGGNHLYGDEKQEKPVENAKTLDVDSPDLDDDIVRQRNNVVVENCRLRCERQTLHRLPKTKALVFAFKTYLYTLSDVKDAGAGPELAEAIDGLRAGSVPAMALYKRQVVWGEAVKAYLAS